MSKKRQPSSDDVYTFIRDYRQQYGYAPTLREMCAALDIGRSTLYRHLDWLEVEGRITRSRGGARGLGLADTDFPSD